TGRTRPAGPRRVRPVSPAAPGPARTRAGRPRTARGAGAHGDRSRSAVQAIPVRGGRLTEARLTDAPRGAAGARPAPPPFSTTAADRAVTGNGAAGGRPGGG